MDGIILIDKLKGPSSFQVVHQLKKLLKIKKIGHAGTLDPLASGLLVVCLGRYTKFAGLLADNGKTYETVIRLGVSTNTDDSEGEIISKKSFDHIEKKELSLVLKHFVGEIEQVPPKYSAIKINGKRAYKLARDNQDFALKARKINIDKILLKDFSLPDFCLELHCSKGTYIRSLARDIGNMLGAGAYAKEIRRLRSGQFDIKNASLLSNLDINKSLIKGKEALNSFLHIEINDKEKADLICGKSIEGRGLLPNKIAIAFFEKDPVAIVREENNKILSNRVI